MAKSEYKNDDFVSSSDTSDASSDSDDDNSIAVDCLNPSVPPTYFGNIDINNSSKIHFGNTTVYNGDVTVQQFVTTTSTPALNAAGHEVKDQSTTQHNLIQPVTDGNDQIPKSLKNYQAPSQQLSIIVTKPEDKDRGTKHRRFLLVLGGGCLLASLVVLLAVLGGLGLGGGLASASALTPAGDWDEFYKNVTFLNGSAGVAPYYTRIDWLAQPVGPQTPLEHPVPFVFISHSATNGCSNNSQCVFQVRKIQTFHIEGRGWLDIGYNFLVGGDGGAYEGRGWDAVGAHTYGYNFKSIGICFVGTFISVLPTAEQVRAAQLLIEEGVRLGKISPNYQLLAHRQVSATESPGMAFYQELKKWPHWVLKPDADLLNNNMQLSKESSTVPPLNITMTSEDIAATTERH